MQAIPKMRVGVFGAGAVGSFLGIQLSAAGAAVTLVGRRWLVEARDELQAVPLGGDAIRPGADMLVTEDASALGDCDVCLVTVKSYDTGAAAETLRDVLRPGVVIVSMQNGLHNAAQLRDETRQTVVSGVVTYNLFWEETGRIRQGTGGPLLLGAHPGGEKLYTWLRFAGITVQVRQRMEPVLQGKLLLNLNNGICAATGLSIRESLESRDARRCFAACLSEGRRLMHWADMDPASLLPISPSWIARLLVLPDFLIRRLAPPLLAVHPSARSSTLQDLERGRPTEIRALNGEIVSIARRIDRPAPANTTVTEVVCDMERNLQRRERLCWMPPAELLGRIRRSTDG